VRQGQSLPGVDAHAELRQQPDAGDEGHQREQQLIAAEADRDEHQMHGEEGEPEAERRQQVQPPNRDALLRQRPEDHQKAHRDGEQHPQQQLPLRGAGGPAVFKGLRAYGFLRHLFNDSVRPSSVGKPGFRGIRHCDSRSDSDTDPVRTAVFELSRQAHGRCPRSLASSSRSRAMGAATVEP
jgi:hypothetical protein